MAGLKRRKPSFRKGLFSITLASIALPSIAVSAANNNPSSTISNIPKLRQRRTQVAVTAFPQNIERGTGSTPEDDGTVIESKNDRRGWPTPAPVASRATPAPVTRSTPAPVPRPTPAPVPRPTEAPVESVDAVQQSATVQGNPPPTVNPLTPWLDELDEPPDFEIEITPVDSNNNNNNNNNVDNEEEEYEQPPSPFFGDYCAAINNQNHTAMLNKQEAGMAGPTYLYTVEVFVVYDETVLTKEDVPEYLDKLNVPVALSVSGCSKQGHRSLLDSNDTAVVEYAEIESWKTSSETNLACEPSPPTEGLVCSVYRSRLIVFLVDNGSKTAEQRRDEFQTLTQTALDEQTPRFTNTNPGIFAFDVHSIDAVTLAANNNDGVAISANSARNNSNSPLLSEKERVVVISVAACIGGLLIGMICMVKWRKSSRCQNAKHMQMDDDDDDDNSSGQTEEWSPPKSLNTSGPYSPSEIQEDLERTYAMTHRGDSFLNRENSLLDDPNARRSVEPRRGMTLQERRRLHPSFDDEYHYDDRDYVMEDEDPICNCTSAERPCSSATCMICENFRTSGIDRGEFLWLKELLPESPVRVPSFDPERPCLCSDTVQL